MTIHQGKVSRAVLVVIKSTDLCPAGVNVASLDEQLLGNILLRDDDELLAHHARSVDGPVLIGPSLEVLPEPMAVDVVNTAYYRELFRPWDLVFDSWRLLSPRQDLPDGREEQARHGQINYDDPDALHRVDCIPLDD